MFGLLRRREHLITLYSRFGRQAASVRHEVLKWVRRGISVSKKQMQPDTSAPTKRIAPGHFVALSRWDVVNTTTLYAIGAARKKEKIMKNIVLENRYITEREEAFKHFQDQFKTDERDESHSPSSKFKLVIEYYEYIEGIRRFSYSKGIITNQKNEIVTVINRNYGIFPYQWIEKDGKEYLLCGTDYQGYTIVELQTGQTNSYVPESAYEGLGFCWVAMYHKTDNDKLAVEGCIWAHEYEIVIYDIENPMALPYKEIIRISPYETFTSWINDNEIEYKDDNYQIKRITIGILEDGPDSI